MISYMEKMERPISDEHYIKWIECLNKTQTSKKLDEIKDDVEKM